MTELNLKQVIAKLKKAKGKRSVRQYAEAIGISHVYLYDVLRGKDEPGPKILDFMGLEKRTTSVTVYVTTKNVLTTNKTENNVLGHGRTQEP